MNTSQLDLLQELLDLLSRSPINPATATLVTALSTLFTPIDSAVHLFSLSQNGRPIKEYVKEFLELSFNVPWNDNTLKTVFWTGLDDSLFW